MTVRRVMASIETSGIAPLTLRQRFALTAAVVDASIVSTMRDEDIDAVFMRHHRVPVKNLRASRLTPLDLKARGCASPVQLRELGFDALDLNDARWCASAVAAFGAEAVRHAFLLDASDAVAVAGSTATMQLEISMRRLMEACAGASSHAAAVLQQSPRGVSLKDVPVEVVLDSGLRGATLLSLGYTREALIEQTGASSRDLEKLAF